jgi:hypothetical protein
LEQEGKRTSENLFAVYLRRFKHLKVSAKGTKKYRRTDRSVSLRNTSSHSSQQTRRRRSDSSAHRGTFDLSRREEEDGTLG